MFNRVTEFQTLPVRVRALSSTLLEIIGAGWRQELPAPPIWRDWTTPQLQAWLHEAIPD